MSYDLAVSYPHERRSDAESDDLYAGLCEETADSPKPHPAVDAFYAELTARYPEIDTVPDDKIDDSDYCPWSGTLDRSPGHVIMTCVWSKADDVDSLVRQLAQKNGLALYDPQAGTVTYPESASVDDARPTGSGRRPWWKFW